MHWICAQIGAREHYAIPRALHQAGQLGALYTDFWSGGNLCRWLAQNDFSPLRPLAARFHRDLADAPLISWNARALRWEGCLRQRYRRDGPAGRYAAYLDIGRRFAEAVRGSLSRRRDLTPETTFFAYDTGALEAMEFLRERGVSCVMGQMDPNRLEFDLVRREEELWPGWQTRQAPVPNQYFHRREQEWRLADRIIVNSDFCRRALLQQGVPAEKLVIIPLSYEFEDKQQPVESCAPSHRALASTPLRVLFLGQVILRKGIQYLMEAARQLRREPIHFDVVGPIGISPEAVACAPPNMTFHGRVNRDRAGKWYRQSDLFVLPTISDGFAITQLEAMSYSLPVITTPNCGEVVRHEIDGLVIPPRSAHALAEAVARFASNRAFLVECSGRARQRSQDFTLRELGSKLRALKDQAPQRPICTSQT